MQRLPSAGAIDNSGEIQAAQALRLTRAVRSPTPAAWSRRPAQAKLHLNAGSIDNTTGRIVNVGAGNTSVAATGHIETSGQIAGNGNLSLSADSLRNQAQGTVSAGGDMSLAVHTSPDNAGTVSSAGALQSNQAGPVLSNSGTVASAGPST